MTKPIWTMCRKPSVEVAHEIHGLEQYLDDQLA